MYKVITLLRARQEMRDIANYIRTEFDSPVAAKRLMRRFKEASARLKEHPFSCPVYLSEIPLEHEYRKLVVKNYIIFYWVDEEKKLVTVARVIHANLNHGDVLT